MEDGGYEVKGTIPFLKASKYSINDRAYSKARCVVFAFVAIEYH